MDLLKLLKDKSEYFTKKDSNSGISNVVTHIEIAEKHFENAKSGDDYLFNDVIYRTNQAFEGILKEAYIIINGSIPNNITPHKIEKYFDDNNVLEERVLQLFTNYRTEWRNKSTHDYKLYFSEQESLLAIVNISAFINILLDQMVEKKSYNTQISMLKSSSKPIISSENLLDKTVEFLKLFSKTIPSMMSGAAIPRISEREILGALNAYINNLDSSIKVYHDYSIIKDNKKRYIADLLLEEENNKVIIEIKNYQHRINENSISIGTKQLLTYLIASDITNGVLYIPPYTSSTELEVSKITKVSGDKTYQIVQIYPRKRILNRNLEEE